MWIELFRAMNPCRNAPESFIIFFFRANEIGASNEWGWNKCVVREPRRNEWPCPVPAAVRGGVCTGKPLHILYVTRARDVGCGVAVNPREMALADWKQAPRCRGSFKVSQWMVPVRPPLFTALHTHTHARARSYNPRNTAPILVCHANIHLALFRGAEAKCRFFYGCMLVVCEFRTAKPWQGQQGYMN